MLTLADSNLQRFLKQRRFLFRPQLCFCCTYYCNARSPLCSCFCIRSVKHLGNLLERSTSCLWEQEPDDNDENHQTCNIYKIESPRKLIEGDGVDVLIEEARRKDGRERDAETS